MSIIETDSLTESREKDKDICAEKKKENQKTKLNKSK